LKRSQQMFADLNKHAVRPTKSLGILYDYRDPASELARKLTVVVPIFNGLTEMEKATISNRSIKLFTLSSIFQATQALLKKKKHDDISIQEEQLAIEYWIELAKHMPDWNKVKAGETNAAFLRKNYIHAHGLALQVFGAIGANLFEQFPDNWKQKLRKIDTIDWSRENAILWEGRALVGGRVSKAHNNVILTTNTLKEILGLPFTKEEEKVEALFNKGLN
jgi:DNA sulfur modification protein DndB